MSNPVRFVDFTRGRAGAGPGGNEAETSAVSASRLLIVDDVLENRDLLGRRFSRRGFEIVEADCGKRALELVEIEPFDIVLLDMMMPEMDGFEVLERIRLQFSASELPVLMVTAKTQSEDIVGALQRGANDYITKPVDFAVALARVNAQIERKRAEEEVIKSNHALQRMNVELEARVKERTGRLMEINQQLKSEIAQRQASEERSQYLAYHDPLTGLGNRLMFREALEKAIEQTSGTHQKLAILFMDLDGFKGVNDTLGHSVGDDLLKVVAARLRDCIKDTDVIARLGGDEFAILQQSETQPASAISLASRMVKEVAELAEVDGQEVAVSASVGIAVARDVAEDPEELLRNADLAMYRAKSDGRGAFRVFDPEMDAEAQARRDLELALRNAFVNGDFELHYQPIMDAKSREVTGFEALLRWNDVERGAVSPSVFVPVAEETGLIAPLGEWIIRQACAEAVKWPEHLKVAINLSPVQFWRGNLVGTIMHALASTGLAPHRLEVEITEGVMLLRTERNIAILNQLRQLGIQIAMDDFGTGYSSLGYLRNFRFDKVKIDQSFIRDLHTNEENLAIVRTVLSLGRSFGMTTLAEGVETQEQYDCLVSEGCREMQGSYFAMAMQATAISGWMGQAETSR